MTIKRFAYASTVVGLLSSVGLLAHAPAGVANPIHEAPTVKASEQGTGTLRQGLPGRRLGGGTRSDRLFAGDYAYLAALVMPDNLSITTAEKPELMFYLPEMVSDQAVEFVLRNEADELVYTTTFQVERAGGMIALDTAEVATLSPLTVNETYRWYLSIIPEANDRANDVVVHGNIRRVEREAWLAQQAIDSETLARLNSTDRLQQAKALYQQANLWHDAANILNELRQANPNDVDIAAEWDRLLTYAGLASVLETPYPTVQITLNQETAS
ncbi:MAG: DUF928 domain-containing protein [Cyanobacteria bacterium J06614_10]